MGEFTLSNEKQVMVHVDYGYLIESLIERSFTFGGKKVKKTYQRT